MKKVTKILTFLLIAWQVSYGQSITGVVTDKSGSTLPGVNIQIKGKTVGTITDIEGKYSLDAVNAQDVLTYSYIGYISKEETVGTRKVINVILNEETISIDELVVVGYGVQKKSLVTGAISSVGTSDFSNSIGRAEQALQGKATGVTVLPSSGSPGAGIKVRIRGAGSNGKSDPLFIVDGMKTGDINYLNPDDIESMEVLKDAASSAIYGTEGANGVVIIKTKGGKISKEATIDYSFQYGVQSMPATPKMMNALQYATFMKEGHAADFPGLVDPAALTDKEGTDWFAAIAENAPMQKHNLSFSGGTDKSTYLASIGYSNQEGIIGGKSASFKRLSTRLNGTYQVKKWLEVGTNFSFTNSKRNPITEDDGFNGVVNSAIMMDPTVKTAYAANELPGYMTTLINDGKPLIKDANGNYYGVSNILQGELYNPLIRLATSKGVFTDNKILTSGYVNIKPLDGLVITSRVGLDLAFQEFNSWSPSYYGNSRSFSDAPSVTSNFNKWSTVLWENYASYTKKINLNTFTALVGTSMQEYNHKNLNTTAGQMIKEDDQFAYPDYVTSRDNDIVTGGATKTRMASYFTRLSYDYDNKYMLEATVRRDGSSLFGSNNKWGNFPSFSAGWVVSQENFWNVEAISFMKFRASWGQNGSVSNLGVDQYRSLITTTGISYPDANGVLQPGAEPALLANASLRWETSEQTNLGLDIQALDGRIYANMDYFSKVTKDLLTPATPALSSGNYAPFANAGDITNTGFEFIIGTRDRANALTYDVNFNLTAMRNEVTYLSEGVTSIKGADLPTLGGLTYFEVGQPVWYYKGYQNDGIFKDQAHIDAWKATNNITDANYKPVPGDPIVKNNVDDGTISDKDMVNIGDPHPNFIYAFNASIGYKGFDFNLFAQGSAGNQNYMGFMRADNAETNKPTFLYDQRWTNTNTVATMPRAGYNGEHLYKSDLMVQDASYLKIRQIELGYTFDNKLTQKLLISKARIYVSLNDYFTFTNYKGFDPEVGSGDNTRQGIDFGSYPTSKKVLFGVSVTL